jgi:chromate reductase
MSKILAFAGSNSSTSINHQLLQYIQTHHLPNLHLIELHSFEIPMYSIDVEQNKGIPQTIKNLHEEIQNSDYLLVATSEHNGSYTSYFKSTIDWLSRLDRDFVKGRKVFICGTSPGRGGALGSIESSKKIFERLGAEVVTTYSLPSFGHSFEDGKLIEENELKLKEFIVKIDN